MRRVTVEHYVQGEVSNEYPDMGVLYENDTVIVVDPYGLIEIYTAHPHPTKGDDFVVIDPHEENLNGENQEFVVNLILNGGKN
ncbi:hypothetical protein [Gottfriedia luciferensis]|uniref:hypothetical protein n=1 Tax=Gottfriedia luciferensis TaxID=178774 RepID=UPI000B43BB39|nr:hypothetical protein [Gottfriedia luciferensis]